MSHYKTGKDSLHVAINIVTKRMACLVNFSYIEAGENNQALVKLVTCERERPESDDDTDFDDVRSKERRKGIKGSSAATDHKIDKDENLDEFLEGMFP